MWLVFVSYCSVGLGHYDISLVCVSYCSVGLGHYDASLACVSYCSVGLGHYDVSLVCVSYCSVVLVIMVLVWFVCQRLGIGVLSECYRYVCWY